MKPLEVVLVVVLSAFAISACESPVSPGGSPTESVVAPSSSALALSSATGARLKEDIPFKRILCFGDSLTFGLTLKAGSGSGGRSVLTFAEGYVPKLARLLTEKHGEGFELFNAGANIVFCIDIGTQSQPDNAHCECSFSMIIADSALDNDTDRTGAAYCARFAQFKP